MTDAQWLCRLAEAGLLRAGLVPPQPIRALRNLTRYRKGEIRDRQREAGRLHKLLEDTGIKLDCIASNLLGKSGRAMLAALIDGTTDADALADLALGKLRLKLPALREAPQGRFDPQHAIIIGRILAHIDYLDEAIAEISTAKGTDRPARTSRRRALHDPRHPTTHRRGDHRGDRRRHDRVPDRQTPHLLGRRVPRQRRIRRQTPIRQHTQGAPNGHART